MKLSPAARAVVVIVPSLLARATALPAQVWTTFDVGAAAVRYGDSVRVTATTLTPRIRFDGGAVAGTATGTLSSLNQGGWTGQGSVDLSMLSPSFGPARVEIAADAGGSVHDDGTRTGQYLGRARLHLGTDRRGLWMGAAAGKTWDTLGWHPMRQGDFGAWTRVGDVQLLAVVTPTAIGDSLRYTDAEAGLRLALRRVELVTGIGARRGDSVSRQSSTIWGGVSATVWVTEYVGLVASGGTYPIDFTQGYPGGRYLSLALRFGARSTAVLSSAKPVDLKSARGSAGSGPRLQIASAPNGQRIIRVHAPGAQSVEMMGDFTAWQPLALTPAPGGSWTATLPLARGIYQLNVRVNGGAWDVPAGAMETVDEFGARVGVIDVR